MVVKVGGSLDGAGADVLIGTLAEAVSQGFEPILVHGGGPAITRKLQAADIELPFVGGLRVTTEAAIPLVVAALSTCNDEIKATLEGAGLAISPFIEGDVVEAKDIDMVRTGAVSNVYAKPILDAVLDGRIPLLPPFGKSATGEYYNLNADVTAAHVAEGCQADRLVFLTDVPGVYADFQAGERLYDTTPEQLQSLLDAGAFTSGMIPKVTAMLYAMERGIPEVWVVDGRDLNSVRLAVGVIDASVAGAQRGTKLVRRLKEEVQAQ